MTETQWGRPIIVETRKTGGRLAIANVEEALVYMLHEWPTLEDGAAFNMALGLLQKAAEGRLDAEDCRSAFVAALDEGNIAIFEN